MNRREPDFEVVPLPPNAPIDLTEDRAVRGQLRPVQLYIQPKGALDDKPSFCFVLTDFMNMKYYAQISERMLRDAFLDAGYNFSVEKTFNDGYAPDPMRVGADEEVE